MIQDSNKEGTTVSAVSNKIKAGIDQSVLDSTLDAEEVLKA